MTAVTQIIPNYLGGVSRQPDEKKSTGQVIDILNGYPDPVYGLTKRNGLEFLTTISQEIAGLDGAAWFFINRDSTELYVACITTTGDIRIWDVLNRVEIPSEDIKLLGDSKEYLGNGLNWTDFEFLTVQDSTMVVNKTIEVKQDYGKNVNQEYLEHPEKYIPNNVATVKVLSIEYNMDYELILKSDYFYVPPIKITSDKQPNVGSSAKLQTASDILEKLAEKIPSEFFEVTILNTSMELKTRQNPGGVIDNVNAITLSQDQSGFLYFTENNIDTYIIVNGSEVPYYIFGNDIIPAGIVRDGVIKICFKNINGESLRIATIDDEGNWDGSYTEVEKILADPDQDPPVSEDSTDYWNEEDRFNNDFDGDRFIGDPDNDNEATYIYTQVVVNERDGLVIWSDQYNSMWLEKDGEKDVLYDDNEPLIFSENPTGIGFFPEELIAGAYDCYGLTLGTGDNIRILYFRTFGRYYYSESLNYRDENGDINQRYYLVEDQVYEDLDDDGYIGDPFANPPVFAPEKPIIPTLYGSPFTIEVKAGRDGKSLDAYQSEVENSARLTSTSIQDRRVKILNTSDDKSSYFVKFVANNPTNPVAGNGYWEEDLGWEEYDGNKDVESYVALASYGVQLETMPHVLRVPEPGKFEFSTYEFDERLVGSELSNPSPSYVDKTINHVFLDNNRLGFLSGENVILSQSGEFGNFYYTSAKTTIESDPIDLNCSSIKPANLHSTVPNAQGLILFSKFEQFILFSESGTLTPSDAVIRSISNYENDTLVSPVDVGTSTMFINKTPGQTRTMGMVTRGLSENPVVVDISKLITDYVPKDIDVLISSPQNSFIAMCSKNKEDIYFYRFFNNGEQDIMQCWFRWQVPGQVQNIFIAQDTLFVLTKTTDGYHLLQSPLSQSSVIEEKLNLKLDNFFSCNDPKLDDQPFVYDANDDLTKLPSPYQIPETGEYIAYNTSQVNVITNPETVDQLSNRIYYIKLSINF